MKGPVEPRVLVLHPAQGAPTAVPLAQACARVGLPQADARARWPALTAALRAQGAVAVVVSAGDAESGPSSHWIDTAHARGWVTPQTGYDIDRDRLPAAWEAQLALGHVPADAALLAWPALPWLSWGEPQSAPGGPNRPTQPGFATPLGLYAIADTTATLRRVLDAGVRSVQLRVKQPHDADAAWHAALRHTIRDCLAVADAHGARLFINDHWRLAAELGASAVHLGQEDLLALDGPGQAEFRASGLGLGVSSHAVWELCRARSLGPQYIACGPVWPTTTKDMPWRPQGLDNLAWWCRVAGAPVVAIGGILTPEQVRLAAAAGAAGVCVLRGLGSDPHRTVPLLQQAFDQGRQEAQAQAGQPVPALHPTLGSAT